MPRQSLESSQQGRIKGGTVPWLNGADIGPALLYEKIATRRQEVPADGPPRYTPDRNK